MITIWYFFQTAENKEKKFYHRNSAYCVTPPNGKKKKKKKNPNAIGKFLFQKTTVSCQVLKLQLSMKPR